MWVSLVQDFAIVPVGWKVRDQRVVRLWEMRRRMRHLIVDGLVMAMVLAAPALARAQDPEPDAGGSGATTEPAAPAEATPADPAAAPPAATTSPAASTGGETSGGETSGAVPDGARFRFGISAGMGFFTAASEVGTAEVSCTYYGGDLRLGAQINDLVGVYVQPTLGYYTADVANVFAAGGLLGVTAIADVTLIDRFFVGAGVGYTIYNSPSGMTPILRVGGYPLMSRSKHKARRDGLMLGADLRFTSLEGIKTIVMPTFNLGYEAF